MFGILALYDKQKEALDNFFPVVMFLLAHLWELVTHISSCTDHGRYYFQKGQRKQFNNRNFTFKISKGRPSTLLIRKLNISAVCVTEAHDDNLTAKIINGEFTQIYGSPECFLSSTWRGILSTKEFRDSLVCVAVDEAHCISQW